MGRLTSNHIKSDILDKPYFLQKMITKNKFFSPDQEYYEEQILFPVPNLIPYKPLYVKPLYQVYNISMTPRHFADYARRDPKGYQAFSDSMWNSFVSITHTIGLSNYFSFTPDFLGQGEALDPTAQERGTQEDTN